MTPRRNRRKQTVPFSERLRQTATIARAAAQRLPAGQERESLLRKALQAETAAHLNEMLSAPIMQAAVR
ncbi:hypothetical protein ACQR16_12480 [Bradyrhizobium oligotrophicum]|uniref:hypothetical protein n=1 Tax=Bradyrhizobium oligotrophicum TaxID=44255 RepID=UPI003EBC6153